MTAAMQQYQARVDAWISQFEAGYFDPLTNMARLSEATIHQLIRTCGHV